ncbi:MAG: AmmeMemoRadiSam system protein B [Gammaproteobacteria bacterium]|nr:AmmeMemoRadiSam system protein B [Gammaproteobacteria bacterium]
MLSLKPEKSSSRPPAVAGLFYPGDAAGLRRAVSAYVAAGRLPDGTLRRPKALIVPHAGYVYSGPVAGSAYRLLRDAAADIRHVVLLGPSHRVALTGLAVPAVNAFTTPLGEVAIDRQGRERLVGLGLVTVADAPHELEHSLEVQLPFLQVVLGEFELLPIAVGEATSADVARVIEAVWNGPETLLLVSSDLSHYHDAVLARRLDAATAAAIVEQRRELDGEQACGATGINGLLLAARRRGLVVEQLDLRNSGDTAGDASRVVGYGSFAVYQA